MGSSLGPEGRPACRISCTPSLQVHGKQDEATHVDMHLSTRHINMANPLVSKTHPSSCPGHRSSWRCSHHIQGRSSQHRDKKPHRGTENALVLQCPRSATSTKPGFTCADSIFSPPNLNKPTCIVTVLSSISISFVKKSAPMVALYSLVNFFCTYWFIKLVCNNQ